MFEIAVGIATIVGGIIAVIVFWDNKKSKKAKDKNNKSVGQVGFVRPNAKIKRIQENIPRSMPRLLRGEDILKICIGAHNLNYDHDNIGSDETELVGEFLDTLIDGVDSLPGASPSFRLKLESDLSRFIEELEHHGLFVFGTKEKQIFEVDGEGRDWYCTRIGIYHKDNDGIVMDKPSDSVS